MNGAVKMSSIFNQFFNKEKENRQPGKVEYKNKKPENTKNIKIKASVFGKVQGVGFRYSTTQTAKKIGVNGIVKNEVDGSVYVEAVGSDEQVDQFITELAKGPSPSAQVEHVEVEYDSSVNNYSGFSERH